MQTSEEDKRKAELLTELVELAGQYWRNVGEGMKDNGTPGPTLLEIAKARNAKYREVLEAFGLEPYMMWYSPE